MVIGSIRTLKTLTLTAMIDNSSEDPLSCFCDQLETILVTRCSIIENFSINIIVTTDADCKIGDEWSLLNKVFTKDAWLELKEVSLKILVYTYD